MKKITIIALLILAISGCSPYSSPRPIKFDCGLQDRQFFEQASEILATNGFEITNQTNSTITGYKADNMFLAQANIYVNVQKNKEKVTINVRNDVTSGASKSTAYYDEENGPNSFIELFKQTIQEIRNICK